MPLSDTYTRLPISSITINRDARQRRTIQIDDLTRSITQIGLINPIIVRHDLESPNILSLVAGERRLEACKALGWFDIPVRFAHDLTPIEASIIELEENIKREDLNWQDRVAAIAKIHSLYLQLDSGWTLTETADATSLTSGTVSMYLRVNSELADPRISDCGTVREAYNVIARRDQRQMGNSLAELLEDPSPPPHQDAFEKIAADVSEHSVVATVPTTPKKDTIDPTMSILNTSFLEWAPSYTGPKFNFIHCDFPYGIDYAAGSQGLGSEHTPYQDTPANLKDLLTCFIDHFNRFASISCHVMFWYSAKFKLTTQFLAGFHSIKWCLHPLIWLRTDNSGVSPDPRRLPRHIYETCLFGSRGDRNLVRVMADAYASPGDRTIHPHTKPEPMLRHFFQMVVDEHTTFLDPTCGSASSLRAAESLGASSVLGLETNHSYCEVARRGLKDARILRRLSP